MRGEIKYIDCGEAIWITKKDWETLKKWFKENTGGLELEEYKRDSVKKMRAKRGSDGK